MRVLAAMSGGVDSAVAAARLRDAGHEVTGVHLALSAKPATMREGARGCCSVEDSRDARRCADVLDIPFYVWDLATRFRDDVVEPFVAEYAAGRTPNPCLRCNEKIKFSAVLERARALGFDAVGTGHYARLEDGLLRRAVDPDKDQSYVLGVLRPDQLEGALFPLGDSPKAQVRAEAAERGLVVAEKPDSHDICFIPSGDTQAFLAERIDEAPGEMVDPSGAVVGHHRGVHDFTVGQRHGLGIARPAPDGRPRYVLGHRAGQPDGARRPGRGARRHGAHRVRPGVARRAAGRSARLRGPGPRPRRSRRGDGAGGRRRRRRGARAAPARGRARPGGRVLPARRRRGRRARQRDHRRHLALTIGRLAV